MSVGQEAPIYQLAPETWPTAVMTSLLTHSLHKLTILVVKKEGLTQSTKTQWGPPGPFAPPQCNSPTQCTHSPESEVLCALPFSTGSGLLLGVGLGLVNPPDAGGLVVVLSPDAGVGLGLVVVLSPDAGVAAAVLLALQ